MRRGPSPDGKAKYPRVAGIATLEFFVALGGRGGKMGEHGKDPKTNLDKQH